MALTPDGKRLYIACGRSNAAAVIDTDTYAKIAEIPVGELPWGVAIQSILGEVPLNGSTGLVR